VSARSAWEHLSDEEVQRAASTFLGDILQVPPMYSALKKNGVPLYVKARAGIVVERAARQLHIARFDVWRDAPSSADVHFAVVRAGCRGDAVARRSCTSRAPAPAVFGCRPAARARTSAAWRTTWALRSARTRTSWRCGE
jgi:tRNA U55 pseudouridine synthase TruB